MAPNEPADVVPLLNELFDPLDPSLPRRAFAIVDAARDEAIYPAVLRADCDWVCLYRGDAAVSMAEVAPYLVELNPLSQFTTWLFDHGWGQSWGIFMNAGVRLESLCNHFRRCTMARLPDGRSVYFRFYDPRVLRVYLPTCTPAESVAMFGPVARYVVEGKSGEMLQFSPVLP